MRNISFSISEGRLCLHVRPNIGHHVRSATYRIKVIILWRKYSSTQVLFNFYEYSNGNVTQIICCWWSYVILCSCKSCYHPCHSDFDFLPWFPSKEHTIQVEDDVISWWSAWSTHCFHLCYVLLYDAIQSVYIIFIRKPFITLYYITNDIL